MTTQRPMPGKEEFSTHISHEKGTHHTTKGQRGNTEVVRRKKTDRGEGEVLARACICSFYRKGKVSQRQQLRVGKV